MINIPIDGRDYDVIDIIENIGPTQYTKKGTPFQSCKIGGIDKISIWQGKGQPLPIQIQGTPQTFSLKASQNGRYINYGGFWKPNMPPSPQQWPATPRSQNKPFGSGDEERIRSMALSYAKDLLVAGVISITEIYDKAGEFQKYIKEGTPIQVVRDMGPQPWDIPQAEPDEQYDEADKY